MALPPGNARRRKGKFFSCGHQAAAGLWITVVLSGVARDAAADSQVGTVLFQADFETQAAGAPPSGWAVLVDKGNSALVTASPAMGKKSLEFTRRGGTVWKPMVSGAISGEKGSALRLDFDWYLPALFDSDARALAVVLRGDGNRAIVTVMIGGKGGVAVRQGVKDWVPLLFPVRAGKWGHLTIVADPISRGAKGAFDVTVIQGPEKMVYANISFTPDWHGQYPQTHWYSPYFHLAAGKPGAPAEACIDNVKLQVISSR